MLNQWLVNFLNSDIRPRYLYEVASDIRQWVIRCSYFSPIKHNAPKDFFVTDNL